VCPDKIKIICMKVEGWDPQREGAEPVVSLDAVKVN
jgi:hypothetical protein